MIKWFDADKFLPGRNTDEVLIRFYYGDDDDCPNYSLGVYQAGQWYEHNDEQLHPNKTVTHWAHINEPFE